MKRIRVIGKEKIIRASTGTMMEDEGLRNLNGVFESRVENVEDEESMIDVANILIDELMQQNGMELSDGIFEIYDADTGERING
mgnify:CR=1 FL=1